MNSGIETVSISTKSAFPNSRLSCSAMAPAHGLRWARTGSGGRARAAGARGELGRGRGGARERGRRGGSAGRRPTRCSSARSRPARLTRQFPLFPRRLPGAVGEETTKRRRRRLVPPLAWSGPGPAAARPTRPGPASPPRPPRPRSRPRGEGHHLLTWAARTRGAAGGGALQAGRRRRGGSALWGQALGAQGGGTEACERRRWVESSFQDCRLRPGLVYANKVTKVSCGASRVDNSLRFCHPAAKPSPALLLTSSPSLK